MSSINPLSSYTPLSSTIFSGVGTLCHEFMHSMGYPDLYRKDTSTGNPVGQWDIMATNSFFCNIPLPTSAMRFPAGWMLKPSPRTARTPYSRHPGQRKPAVPAENAVLRHGIFAVEYRKPGKQYLMSWTPKSTARAWSSTHQHGCPGNYRGDTDGIYVFRPGETALNAGQGDLTRSCYGGTNAPDSIGTTDLTKRSRTVRWSSDGTNSGIALDDIQIQPDGTLTFSASFADVSDRQLWQSVCDVPTSRNSRAMICVPAVTAAFIWLPPRTAHRAYRLDGDTLTPVSTAISGSVYNPKLAFAGNTPTCSTRMTSISCACADGTALSGNLLYRDRTGTVCRHDCIRRQAVSPIPPAHSPTLYRRRATTRQLTPCPPWAAPLRQMPATWRSPSPEKRSSSATGT
ncbi:MAG: immune inhibitor A domain-containing protein [Ruminococcus callidus]